MYQKSCSEFGNLAISWKFEIDFQKCEIEFR